MKQAVIGVAALVVAVAGNGQRAAALPGGLPIDAGSTAQLGGLMQVRSNRYHRGDWRQGRAEAADPGAVKPGQWEFAVQLQNSAPPQLPAGPQSPLAAPIRAGGASKTTYRSCIVSERAVPTAFASECALNTVQRDGPQISWSMTCTNPRNSVRSDGVAHYRGETMEATVISHLPGADGTASDVTQHITGRYLGPCTQVAEGSTLPAAANTSRPDAPRSDARRADASRADAPPGQTAQWLEPPAAAGSAKPPAAAAERSAAAGDSTAAAAPERTGTRTHLRRSVGYRRHVYHRYYSRGGWPWGGLSLPILGRVF